MKNMSRFANFLARASLGLGVILPLFTLVFEGVTHACSGSFFDPLPTWWHYLVILPVPIACFLTLRLWKNPSEQAVERLSLVTRMAWPVVLLYMLPLAWMSVIACVMLPMTVAVLFSKELSLIHI